MALEKRSYLYEVLIRFDANGYAGSHVCDLEQFFEAETGEVFSTREGQARPLTAAEVGPVLGAQTSALIEAADTARTTAAAAAAAAAEREAALSVSIAALTAENAELRSRLEA